MNFFNEEGSAITVEGFSPNITEGIQQDKNNTTRRIELFGIMMFNCLADEQDLSLGCILLMLRIDTMQLQVSRSFGELHINPAMGMSFLKIVTDRWLSNDMEMLVLAFLPFMGVAMDIRLGMLSPGKYF